MTRAFAIFRKFPHIWFHYRRNTIRLGNQKMTDALCELFGFVSCQKLYTRSCAIARPSQIFKRLNVLQEVRRKSFRFGKRTQFAVSSFLFRISRNQFQMQAFTIIKNTEIGIHQAIHSSSEKI